MKEGFYLYRNRVYYGSCEQEIRGNLKDRKVKQRRAIKIWLNLLIRPEEK